MAKNFVEMEPDKLLKAVEGVEDVLTPAYEERLEEIRSKKCPKCKSRAIMKVDPNVLFEDEAPLPAYMAFCPICDKPI